MHQQDSFYLGRAVTSLQTMLRTIASTDDSIPTVIPDGIYGAETRRAVIAFQRRAGLPATGVTDFDTWNAIRDAYQKALVEVSPAAPLQIVMNPGEVLLPGSDNLNVLLVQAMLHNIHLAYGNLPDCSLSGTCDETTEEAIRQLQKCCGMQPTGILTKQLWQLLTGLYFQAVGDGDRQTVCGKAEK